MKWLMVEMYENVPEQSVVFHWQIEMYWEGRQNLFPPASLLHSTPPTLKENSGLAANYVK
jgi:hypothetical protein